MAKKMAKRLTTATDLEALELALSELPGCQQQDIEDNVEALIDGMVALGARNRNGFGRLMALELLHSVGRYWNEHSSDFMVQ